MNNLMSKMQEAANLFQNHEFKKSLQLYDQCISICKKNQEPKSLLHNLMSSKGALMSILGDQKGALECLNEVLSEDQHNTLCLMRRSQVLKKKNKLNKALKDLKVLGYFSPDNLQIAAMKIQIQNMKLKCKQANSSSESEQHSEKSNSSEDLDEQEKLNFSNLKCIDRKSVSIMMKPNNARKSRVTIAGDIAIVYDAPEDEGTDDKSFASTNVSKQYLKEKYIRTFKEIQLDDQEQSNSNSKKQLLLPVINVKAPNNGRTKSILKNRESKLYVDLNRQSTVQKDKKYGGRESKMIDVLKNIDGKVIASTSSQRSSITIKEVEFRKSIFGNPDLSKVAELNANQKLQLNLKPKTSRKSCLRRPSFDIPKQQVVKGVNQPRRSKFEMMSKMDIDGVVIRSHRKSIQLKSIQLNGQVKQNTKSESDSDQGSQHNIFGSNQIIITKQMRLNLGLGEDSDVVKKPAKPRSTGGKSILKRNSVLTKSSQKLRQPSPFKQIKKSKKSVMFLKFD